MIIGDFMAMDEDEQERVIEAALFMSSRPLSLQEMGKLIGVAAPGFVEQRVNALAIRYTDMESAIEIVGEGGKYYMRLRQQYAPYVKDFSQAAEITPHALRTLAYVAKNEGITKRQLFLKLGSGIYEDVAELAEKGFVSTKKAGRTKSVSTTPKFKSYFGQGV
jgi:segregation and condensation protein B